MLSWLVLSNASEMCSFLGLVRYLAVFLPLLTKHTDILSKLTTDSEKDFPLWMLKYQFAFDAVKTIVTSRDCLTTIDLTKLPEYKIFMTTNASDKCSGAILYFGKDLETIQPVAFDSMTFKKAELNYHIHEKEMLAIIRALKKRRVDLLGLPFFVYVDQKTLKIFNTQKDLSRWQARWMEFMSQFDAWIVYIKGKDNCVANALSCIPIQASSNEAEKVAQHPYQLFDDDAEDNVACIWLCDTGCPWQTAKALSSRPTMLHSINATLNISTDKELLKAIHDGYKDDTWCTKLETATHSFPQLKHVNGLWYIGD